MLEGRDFDARDDEKAAKVTIVNRTMARRIRATGRAPLGQRVRTFGEWRSIIGVVADARYRRVVEAMDDVYVPDRQATPPTNYLVLRGHAPPAELLALVRRSLKELDPSHAIANPATLNELRQRHTARNRFSLSLMLLFAAGAVVLAAAGIHSVIGESVAVRANEIAVKAALGASRGRLVKECMIRALRWVLLGEVAGIAVALFLSHSAADLLYTVSPKDPWVLSFVTLLVFAIACGAALRPAWSAVSKDARATLQSDLG